MFAQKKKCKAVHLSGDFLNNYSVSSFPKNKNITIDDEYYVGEYWLEELKKVFDDVSINFGNHEERIKRFLGRITRGQISDMQKILKSNGDALAVMANATGCLYSKDWWAQLGEIITCHPSKYSSVWGKNLTNSVDYFLARMPKGRDVIFDEDDSMRIRPFRAVVQGHSHKIFGNGKYRGVQMYELGCMCHTIDFNVGSRQTQPIWERAFGILRLENGHIVFNESRVYDPKELL